MDSKRQRVMPEPVAGGRMPYDEDEWADRLEIARARREKVLAMRAAQKEAKPVAAPEPAPEHPAPEPAPEPAVQPKPEPAERLKSALRAARPGTPARQAVAAAPTPRIRAERREAEPELRERPEPPARQRRSGGRGNLYLATLLIGIAAGSAATVKVMDWLEEDIDTSAPAISIDPPKVAEATPAAVAAPVTDQPREAMAPAPVLEEAPAETEVAVVTPDPEPAVQPAPPKPATKPVARPTEDRATAPAKPAEERAAGVAKPKGDGAGESTTTAEANTPNLPASDSTVRIYAPRSVAAGELDAVGATLRDQGIVKQSTDRVGYNVGTSQVRYYHAGDAAEAKRIAKAVNATPRDFTDRQSAAAEGTLEVYLAGTSPGGSTARRAPEPPLAEATAAVQSFVNNLAAQMRQGMQR